jgi:hypothetical protein
MQSAMRQRKAVFGWGNLCSQTAQHCAWSELPPVFIWRPLQPVEEIDSMKPALVYAVPRTA